ncbi:Alpha/Beta hydrolase protein [Mucor lusitanicus]|uniref:Alpha/Beta hydrolase protein n=1 Tax=Mucor circinelloides f. lusitanicus TaxID=29924 RepID=A0A8H4B775_MUCCL|nr:Alpha/Beta hydrolase protein [Mucor lusitanicus]
MLLQKVGWTKCDVVGVSLGGATAVSFANYYPEMVDKTVLIAPAGIMNEKTDLPLISRIIRLPFVYQVIINQPVFRDFMLKNVQKFANSTKSKLTNYPQETLDQGKKISTVATYQFAQHPGFIRAFAGTVVAYPLTGLHDKFKKLGQQDRDVLVVWGDRDTVSVNSIYSWVETNISRYRPAPEQAHNVLSTRWESVHATIEKFLTS